MLFSSHPSLKPDFQLISRQLVADSILEKAKKNWRLPGGRSDTPLRRTASPAILPDVAMLMGNDEYSVRDNAMKSEYNCIPYHGIITKLLQANAEAMGWLDTRTGMATRKFFNSLGTARPPMRWETYCK